MKIAQNLSSVSYKVSVWTLSLSKFSKKFSSSTWWNELFNLIKTFSCYGNNRLAETEEARENPWYQIFFREKTKMVIHFCRFTNFTLIKIFSCTGNTPSGGNGSCSRKSLVIVIPICTQYFSSDSVWICIGSYDANQFREHFTLELTRKVWNLARCILDKPSN